MKPRTRRTFLYVPGDDRHKIEKAIGLGADCICLDIEDGVAPNHKDQARATIAQALAELDFGAAEKLVRVNPADSGLQDLDLAAILPARPQGIVVPKVGSPEQVQQVGRRIAADAPGADIRLVVLIESAQAIVNLKEIAAADPRLDALIFGAEDLAADLGTVRSAGALEVLYAREAVVVHAAARGLQAIDMVYLDFRDAEGLEREGLEGARLGFSGKQIIHPNQVEPVRRAFTPSADQVARARQIVESYEEHAAAGLGAFALDGKMVDMPIVKAAQRLLARAG